VTRRRYARIATASAFTFVVGPALPQTIRIPDFRTQPTVFQPKPGESCTDCGRVVAIREVPIERRAPLPAGFDGASRGTGQYNLVGAVVYLPLSGSPSDRPFVGGVGTPEMRERFGETTYEVTVRMDNAAVRTVARRDGSRFRVGDRVRSSAPGELDLVLPD
jgi:hypothetical protein